MKEVSDKRHARAPLALWVTAVEWLRARFELSRGGAGQNIRPMEGLRGFAVFLVFLVHYSNLIRPWLLPESSLLEFAKALRLVGSSGVDLFFVLSGYVIYGSLISRAQPLGRFVLRRVRRIYPAFIVVLSGYVVLSLLAGRESKIPDGAGAGVVYIVSNVLLLPGLFPIEPLVAVAWSLSYEMFYYFTIPRPSGGLCIRRDEDVVVEGKREWHGVRGCLIGVIGRETKPDGGDCAGARASPCAPENRR